VHLPHTAQKLFNSLGLLKVPCNMKLVRFPRGETNEWNWTQNSLSPKLKLYWTSLQAWLPTLSVEDSSGWWAGESFTYAFVSCSLGKWQRGNRKDFEEYLGILVWLGLAWFGLALFTPHLPGQSNRILARLAYCYGIFIGSRNCTRCCVQFCG